MYLSIRISPYDIDAAPRCNELLHLAETICETDVAQGLFVCPSGADTKTTWKKLKTSALKRLCNPHCLNYLKNGIYKATQDEVNNAIEQHRSAELESAVAYLRELCITKTNPAAEAPEIMTKDTDIEELDLSVRCFNCVKRAKINKIGDLEKLTFRELHRIRNLGKQAYDDLISKLAEHGFSFQEETDPDERIVLKKLPVIIG